MENGGLARDKEKMMGCRHADIEKKIFERGYRPPRKDGVIILEDDLRTEEVLPSGIIIPAKTTETLQKEATREATVISVGKWADELKPGDRVLFHKAYGIRIPHGDEHICRLLYLTLNQLEAAIED